MVYVCIYVRYILIEKIALFVLNAVISTIISEKSWSKGCSIGQKLYQNQKGNEKHVTSTDF